MAKLDKLEIDELNALARKLHDERDALNLKIKEVSNERRTRLLTAEGHYERRDRALSEMTDDELAAEMERRAKTQGVGIPDTVRLLDVHAPGE